MTYSFYQALNQYDFTSDNKKQALINLLQQAEIDISFNKTYHNFNAFTGGILSFVSATQDKFVIRKGFQERWEVNPLEWMQHNQTEKFEFLKTLDIITSFEPITWKVDVLCILGSTAPSMKGRIDYAVSLIDKGLEVKQIVLSAGERYANTGQDGDLEIIASYNNLISTAQVTETHIIKYLYEYSILNNSYPVHIIDTPRGELTRPTTRTTMVDLVQWINKQSEQVNNVLFISSQPNVLYQKAVISEAFRHLEANVFFEVVGNAYKGSSLQAAIGALGSYIYAQTPNMLISYGEPITDRSIIDSFKEIYKSQPLIFNNAIASQLFLNSFDEL